MLRLLLPPKWVGLLQVRSKPFDVTLLLSMGLAIMVLGILKGERASDNDELKSQTYSAVQVFMEKFTDEFQSSNCGELTGGDFKSDAGNEKFKNEGVMENICAPCVKRAVEIVEALK